MSGLSQRRTRKCEKDKEAENVMKMGNYFAEKNDLMMRNDLTV